MHEPINGKIETPNTPLTWVSIAKIASLCEENMSPRAFEIIDAILNEKWPTLKKLKAAQHDDLVRAAILLRATGVKLGWCIDAWKGEAYPSVMSRTAFAEFALKAADLVGDKSRLHTLFLKLANIDTHVVGHEEVAFIREIMAQAKFYWIESDRRWEGE